MLPVVSRHQRLPRLWLDPVKWWAIGFSFQLAINQQSVCTSSAWLLPPGQGRPVTCTAQSKLTLSMCFGWWETNWCFPRKKKAYNELKLRKNKWGLLFSPTLENKPKTMEYSCMFLCSLSIGRRHAMCCYLNKQIFKTKRRSRPLNNLRMCRE